jgi:hypothetical protein
VPDSDTEDLGGRPTNLSPHQLVSNDRASWKPKSLPEDKVKLHKHRFNEVNDALQLLMLWWQQIDTILSKPSDPLDPRHVIRDEFADILCALRKHFMDIQAEFSKSEKQACDRWEQTKIAENCISLSEDYRRGKGYQSNNTDTEEESMQETRMERQLSEKMFSAEVADRMREFSKSVLNTANAWKDAEAMLKKEQFLEDIADKVLLHFRLITFHLWSTANQLGSFEDLEPTDSEEGRNIMRDLLSPYGHLYTRETEEKFWRNMNQYMSPRYSGFREEPEKSQQDTPGERSNYKRMRDDDCDGDDECEAFGDRQCFGRTRRRIPAPNKRKRQRHNNEVD